MQTVERNVIVSYPLSPLAGESQSEGEMRTSHPHLASPVKGEVISSKGVRLI